VCADRQFGSSGALHVQTALASASLGAHLDHRLGSTTGQSRDAISEPDEAVAVERGLALQSHAIPDLLGGL